MVKKKTEIEAPANAALQASITPVGIEFGMGIFSLDLSKTLVLRIHSTDENVIADLTSKIQQFIVK